MTQSKDELTQSDAIEVLGVELQRLSVGADESQAAAALDDDFQGDDECSSSSESSAGLPSELHLSDGTRAGPQETLPPSAPTENDASVGLLYDQSMEQHFGPDHYERPSRIIQMYATLQEQGLLGRCWRLVPRQATDEELLLGHSEDHIRKVDSMFSELYPSRPDTLADAEYCYADGRMGDVYVCGGTARAARFAAGCCVQAVQSVLSGEVARALAVVRPPGHHAECERAMGFCFFNNVAVAALAALQTPGTRRVAVLDWDVHHGNGIQNMLLQRPDALYISIHRDPKRFYPYTSGFLGEAGEGSGTGFNVNVPWLKKGMGDGDYRAAFSLIVEPLLESYQPDLVIVAAGFDAADGDPLGACKVSPEGYGWMTERLLRFAGGKLVLALEGGYNNRVTSWCAAACVRTLLEGRAAPPLPPDKDRLWPAESHNSLKLVYEFQRQHWPVLRARSWTEAWDAHLKDVSRLLGGNLRSKRSSAAGSNSAITTTTTTTTTISNNSSGKGSTCGGAALLSPTGAGGGDGAAAAPAAVEAPTARRSGGHGDSACGGNLVGPPPASQSLQEAFKARKAARDAAAAERAAAVAAAAAAAAALPPQPPSSSVRVDALMALSANARAPAQTFVALMEDAIAAAPDGYVAGECTTTTTTTTCGVSTADAISDGTACSFASSILTHGTGFAAAALNPEGDDTGGAGATGGL
ncbi:hypothetical protein VOLCADRAFT_120505 [Volvox carteri f. nagariensis]|uniref:histone deacetylase n=1 Tax=Volvox carteri f. nagariensis TaxID=3068 RepID=D8TMS2_VOLCA|nr:uncharacterized protein VOLCADRAFT_120505 [Volvox carteri f. nagariensis]EFJ51178.1 hypothetical protein VOLCADRAFT_120505 [Volvox carteri f. nagariensis]|eukprot:XP_002947645.1 hypothetical protein VOLCADRAFT_120505 [Volvox carteri f. nagariensis]